jgi:dipeptidyl aminopeptidase/acylaminoacyl peptidase
VSTVPIVPRQVLFGNPERISPRVAPDGSRLAWIGPDDGVLNVWVAPIDRVEEAAVVTDDRDRGIRDFFWAHDGRHLLYLQDRGGDENWRLYAVDLTEGKTRDLTPFEGVRAEVIDVDRHHPDELLIGLNRDRAEWHDVYRVHLPTGELTKVAENPGVLGWVADAEFQMRGSMRPKPDGGMELLVRDAVDGPWRVLLDLGPEDALTTDPVAFDRTGGRLLILSSVGANASRLLWIDLDSGGEDVVAADPVYDVAGITLDSETRAVQVVTFLRDRAELVVIDPTVAGDIEALSTVQRGDLTILSRDLADRTWLVAYSVDDGPVAYYVWNRARRQAVFLFHHQPALSNYQLARMEPFAMVARDGLELHGYLTFPPGEPKSGLPAVLDVHGGPWARDTWGFNPEAQWLANRGYVCIQVNYRGSTGYGKDFANAGDRQWGAKMHEDLLDALAWVLAQGWVDPARVAIYGASYGGYAALIGATFTPEVFRAAVDIVGPSNLKTLIESIPPYWAPMIAQLHNRVGNPETDAEFLWSRSPLSRVADVGIPLLIAQGANDPRVKQAESEQIVAALKANGIDHQYLLFPDEGHGFAKPENRLRFYAAAEAFLAEHLGGRVESS